MSEVNPNLANLQSKLDSLDTKTRALDPMQPRGHVIHSQICSQRGKFDRSQYPTRIIMLLLSNLADPVTQQLIQAGISGGYVYKKYTYAG